MALSEDFLYQLKQANPIDSVMSSYVNLIRRGRNYVCLCPFHSEKSPSCTVYPETDSFYCFGCGAGGDTVNFIRLIENLEYMEAVKLLAERSGIMVPEDSSGKDYARVKAKILEMNREAARFFYSQLVSPQGRKGLSYFAGRKLKPETIKKYGLGFAPDDWNLFRDHMNSLGYRDDELVNASLCKTGRNGSVYSTFRNRVIFPIIDLRGNIIAFGGRILDGEGPKYLNSSDTPVFKKSRNLFSLNFAKNSSVNRLILAEGYMDVISINQAGFENVVATLGTALTPEQARLMSNYAKEVIIAYDSDGPGQAATHRAINLLSEVGITTRIMKMEGAKDPDEYIKKYGAIRFKLLLDNSDGAIAFELEKCKNGLDLYNDTGKIEFLKRAVAVIAEITSPLEREIYISRISEDNKIDRETVKANVEGIIKRKNKIKEKREWNAVTSAPLIPDKINPEAVRFPRESKAEQGIIRYLFMNPDRYGEICKKISPDDFVTDFNRKVFKIFSEKIRDHMEISLTLLNSEFSAGEMGKITEIIAKNREIAITEKEVSDFIDVLKKKTLPAGGGNISDEELRELQKNLKIQKSDKSIFGG